MPFVHGKNSVIWMWDAGGTCRNLSGDKNNVTLAWDRDNPESTTFGKMALQRLTGLQDATISGAGLWNSDSDSGIDEVFEGLLNANAPTLLLLLPSGSSPAYGLYVQVSQYDIVGPVGGVTAVDWEAELALSTVARLPGGMTGGFTVGYSQIGYAPIS